MSGAGVRAGAQQQAKPVRAVPLGEPARGLLQRKCACGGSPGAGGECTDCQKKKLALQRKESGASGPATAPPIVHEVLSSPGRRLDREIRAFMEPRFGHDFSRVRIHTDARAAESARAVRALAYTFGRDVVFGAGKYVPGSVEGQHLIAHELTHVIQQSGGSARAETIESARSSFEQEAEQVASVIPKADHEIPVGHHGPERLARNGDEGAESAARPVSLVEISCGTNAIIFHTRDGASHYGLTSCDVSEGDYTASVQVSGNNVAFNLGEASEATRFDFQYSVEPGQPNPSTFFGSQSSVHIVAHPRVGLFGESVQILAEIPITILGQQLAPPAFSGPRTSASGQVSAPGELPGEGVHLLTDLGLAGHVLASGDLSWLSSREAARRVLSRQYWSPFVPSRGTITLDRLLNTLPRSLAPKIEGEIAAGQRLSWIARGFTEAELESVPDLVRRLNERGVSGLSTQELQLLRRSVSIQIGGSTAGSPFASYTRPNFDLESWASSRYRVRVEVPSSGVLDVSVPNEFNQGMQALTNVEEAEFLVTANQQRTIVSVQRMNGSSQPSALMRYSGAIRWGGRAVFVLGIGVSGYRIATASAEERPVVIAEEAGGMAGGALGTSAAVAGCLLFGIASGGLGLFLCGLGGGIVGGVVGSGLAGELARGGPEGRPPCPSCHEIISNRSNISGDLSPGYLGSFDDVGILARPGAPGTMSLSPEEMQMIRRWLETGR